MQGVSLDKTDLRILDCLQREGRLSHVDLAERVHLSASQCQRRVRRLEQAGVIGGYAALLERRSLGLGVMAFVSVRLEKHAGDPVRGFERLVSANPAVLECWAVTGDSDYLLRVVAVDLEALSDLLLRGLLSMPMVAGVKSTILLQQVKSTTALPLPAYSQA